MTEHGAALTLQLLAFGRRQVLAPRVVQLNDIVKGMQHLLARLLGEQIQFDLQCEPHLPTVRVDVAQIEQVIINLALNAKEAMPSGGNTVYPFLNRDGSKRSVR